jgi:hypothetical protein
MRGSAVNDHGTHTPFPRSSGRAEPLGPSQVSDIAALEDELIECAARPLLLTLPRPASPSADAPLTRRTRRYVGRLRAHEHRRRDDPAAATPEGAKANLRFSSSFVANTDHVVNELLPKLHAEVDRAKGLAGCAAAGTGLAVRNLAPKSRSVGECYIGNHRKCRCLARDWLAP